jgi:hypothetical protein
MPCISRFYGISVYVYYSDHAPAHVHARYAGRRATLEIRSGVVLDGHLPPRATRLVRMWLGRNRKLVEASWSQARAGRQPDPIPPLD